MTTIYAATSDQVLVATRLPKVGCNNQNTVKLHVEFDSPWNGYTKSAVFHTSKDPTPYEMILSSDGNCIVPAEVLAEEATLYIGVRGIKTSTREIKSSTLMTYKILPGTPSMVISDPAPSVYQQLLTENAVLRSRMSGIEAAGTVEGSEIIGVRTGVDGTKYATAGDAVRQQVTDIYGVLNGKGTTLTKSSFEQGSWAAGEGGYYASNLRIRSTLPISKGDVISVNPNGQFITFLVIEDKEGVNILDSKSYTSAAFDYGCSHNGYIVFIVCADNVNSVKITPEELTAQITIYRTSSSTVGRGKAVDPKARLGFVVSAVTATTINTVQNSLQSGHNEVFIDCAYGNVTEDTATLCADADIPLEVWTVNSENVILALDPYISGVTSDSLIAGNLFYENSMDG